MEHQISNENQISNVEVMLPEKYNGDEQAGIITNFSPMDMPVQVFTDALNRREANRKALLKLIKNNLTRGVDFGTIHMVGKGKCQYARDGRAYACPIMSHWSKDTLFKPGGEKIAGMMALTPKFPNVHLYEEAVVKGQDINVIILKCELHTSQGHIVGEGTGARIVSKDYGDINKAMKMAEKSAMINAILRVGGLSEIFTQDLETMFPQDDDNSKHQEPPVQKINTSQTVDNKSNGNGNGNGNGSKRISSATYNHLINSSKHKGLTYADIKKMAIERFAVMPEHLRENEGQCFISEIKTS